MPEQEIKRGEDYPASWGYAEAHYTKEKLKEMAEKYLPSIYPIKKEQIEKQANRKGGLLIKLDCIITEITYISQLLKADIKGDYLKRSLNYLKDLLNEVQEAK